MENKSSKKLENLPESNTDFWDGAEVHTNLIPHTEISEDGHFFELVSAVEAQCKRCGWGFQLDPGDKIKEGHLYEKGKKFVI